jgi:4,5-DOPA dioxygenase extradiol
MPLESTLGSRPTAAVYPKRRDMRAPALFVSFGSPLALRDEAYAQALRRFGIHLRQPRGIIVASANWRTVRPLRITSTRRPTPLHDYGDFPRWLETLKYPCPGSPLLASEAAALLNGSGIGAVLDPQQGLDHGVWMPVSLLYASARVPVVQVSLPSGGSPEDMLAVGRALAPLRRSGYLVLGTGSVVFNPHRARFDQVDAPPEPWARSFDEWLGAKLEKLDITALANYRREGPHAHLSAPTSEHIDPLFFTLGATLQGDLVRHLFEGFHAGSTSLRSCVIAGRRADDLRLPDELLGA